MDNAAEVLDLDIGNTRTKWRCGTRGGALAAPRLPPLPRPPARVRIATVRGDRAMLAAAVERRYGAAAEFAAVTPALAGVRCGYRQPERLGIDRWLSVVAAWDRVRIATAVIGAGTAATFDYVADDGGHQGGCIAPGLALMRMALRCGTADAGLRAAASAAAAVDGCDAVGGPAAPAPLGRSTAAALAAGTFTMLAGFAEAALAGCADRAAAVFVTGGDAPLLTAVLASAWPGPVRHVPTLVLDGLAIALP